MDLLLLTSHHAQRDDGVPRSTSLCSFVWTVQQPAFGVGWTSSGWSASASVSARSRGGGAPSTAAAPYVRCCQRYLWSCARSPAAAGPRWPVSLRPVLRSAWSLQSISTASPTCGPVVTRHAYFKVKEDR